MNLYDARKAWVNTYESECVGPFDSIKEAQEYINDRDDHGYDVREWKIVTFQVNYHETPQNHC